MSVLRSLPPAVPAAAETSRLGVYLVGGALSAYAATIGVRVSVAGLTVPTICLVVACLGALLTLTRTTLGSIRPLVVDVVGVGYLVARLSSEFFASHALQHPFGASLSANTAYYLLAYACARVTVASSIDVRRFFGCVMAPASAVAVLGALQAAHVGIATRLVLAHTSSGAAESRLIDDRLTRATSTIGHWSALGGYLCCVCAVCGVCAVMDRRSGRRSPWPLVNGMFCLIGAVSTFTLSAVVIVTAVALATFAALGRRIVGLAGLLSVAVVSWLVFGASISSRIAVQSVDRGAETFGSGWLPATLAVRIPLWTEQGLPAWREQPVWGWGHSVYSSGQLGWPVTPGSIVWPYPESEYVKALVTGGVVELAALLVLGLVWLRALRRSDVAIGRSGSAVLLTVFIGLAIGSVVNPYFTNQGVPGIWWPIVGAIAWCGTRRPGPIAATPEHAVPPAPSEPQ